MGFLYRKVGRATSLVLIYATLLTMMPTPALADPPRVGTVGTFVAMCALAFAEYGVAQPPAEKPDPRNPPVVVRPEEKDRPVPPADRPVVRVVPRTEPVNRTERTERAGNENDRGPDLAAQGEEASKNWVRTSTGDIVSNTTWFWSGVFLFAIPAVLLYRGRSQRTNARVEGTVRGILDHGTYEPVETQARVAETLESLARAYANAKPTVRERLLELAPEGVAERVAVIVRERGEARTRYTPPTEESAVDERALRQAIDNHLANTSDPTLMVALHTAIINARPSALEALRDRIPEALRRSAEADRTERRTLYEQNAEPTETSGHDAAVIRVALEQHHEARGRVNSANPEGFRQRLAESRVQKTRMARELADALVGARKTVFDALFQRLPAEEQVLLRARMRGVTLTDTAGHNWDHMAPILQRYLDAARAENAALTEANLVARTERALGLQEGTLQPLIDARIAAARRRHERWENFANNRVFRWWRESVLRYPAREAVPFRHELMLPDPADYVSVPVSIRPEELAAAAALSGPGGSGGAVTALLNRRAEEARADRRPAVFDPAKYEAALVAYRARLIAEISPVAYRAELPIRGQGWWTGSANATKRFGRSVLAYAALGVLIAGGLVMMRNNANQERFAVDGQHTQTVGLQVQEQVVLRELHGNPEALLLMVDHVWRQLRATHGNTIPEAPPITFSKPGDEAIARQAADAANTNYRTRMRLPDTAMVTEYDLEWYRVFWNYIRTHVPAERQADMARALTPTVVDNAANASRPAMRGTASLAAVGFNLLRELAAIHDKDHPERGEAEFERRLNLYIQQIPNPQMRDFARGEARRLRAEVAAQRAREAARTAGDEDP